LPIQGFRRLALIPANQDRAGPGRFETEGNRGTPPPVREAWTVRYAASFASKGSSRIGGPGTGTAGITTVALWDGANSNDPFAPGGRYAFRVDRLPRAFLHSLMLAANKSGSMITKTTAITILSALTCMMISFPFG
jgi:hypothetical protein